MSEQEFYEKSLLLCAGSVLKNEQEKTADAVVSKADSIARQLTQKRREFIGKELDLFIDELPLITFNDDAESMQKAVHDVDFLCSDLQSLVSSKNPMLNSIALDLLRDAQKIQNRLKQILSINKE